MGHINLAIVHKVYHNLEVGELDILQNDNGMLARVDCEEGLEVRAAGRQDDFVRLEMSALGGECHINEGFIIQETRENGDKVGLVVVPTQTELLHRHLCWWISRWRGRRSKKRQIYTWRVPENEKLPNSVMPLSGSFTGFQGKNVSRSASRYLGVNNRQKRLAV